MKQVMIMAVSALLFASCQKAPDGFVINGEVTDMPDGKIYLKAFRNKMFFTVDSTEI